MGELINKLIKIMIYTNAYVLLIYLLYINCYIIINNNVFDK